MRIVNNTTNTILVSDLLQDGITQYQDGVKVFTLGPSASALIPNLQGANSRELKKLVDTHVVSISTAFEPLDIIGMAGI